MYDDCTAEPNGTGMISGGPYDGARPEFLEARAACAARKPELDAIVASDMAARVEALAKLFGATDGPCIVQPLFQVEFGMLVSYGFRLIDSSGWDSLGRSRGLGSWASTTRGQPWRGWRII